MPAKASGTGKRGGGHRPPTIDLKEAAWGLVFRVALGVMVAVAATVAQHGSVRAGGGSGCGAGCD